MHFKTDWTSLIVGSKITIFALFYFVFEGNFSNTSPLGTYFWRGALMEGFFALLVWGACIWTGLFSEFYGIVMTSRSTYKRPLPENTFYGERLFIYYNVLIIRHKQLFVQMNVI